MNTTIDRIHMPTFWVNIPSGKFSVTVMTLNRYPEAPSCTPKYGIE